jgi:hypothetical protein
MQSAAPPLVGFNNNVRYRGMRFHIQTEDSGVTRPHIITHLFADGGRVIKSLRTDYSEYVDHPDRPALLARMMRDQHRAMAIELRDGKLDATIDGLLSQAPEPGEDLDERPRARPAEPTAPPRRASQPGWVAPIAIVGAQHDAEPPPDSKSGSAQPKTAEPAKEARRSRPPPGRSHRPSRAPEAAKKRRSVVPKARRSLGRPSAISEAKPSAESIFGAAPQESLDDVILSYVSHGKNTPDSRGRK